MKSMPGPTPRRRPPRPRPAAKGASDRPADLERQPEALARELAEAREQQAATSEILRAMSRSPSDMQPVLDGIVRSAAHLCAVEDCEIRLFDANVHRPAAHYGSIPPGNARPFAGRGPVGPAMREGRTVHILDALEEYPETLLAQLGVRTALIVPLVREGTSIGMINLRRLELRPFSDRQIKLLETFADQAVIAIENVRLFKELQMRNAELSDALEQQTATAEVLRVISSSPTHIQPVLDAVAESAARLCAANHCVIRLVDGDMHIPVAHFGSLRVSGPCRLRRAGFSSPQLSRGARYTYTMC